jgi:ABC-type glycerol-3-phosphate transport system permease component
VYAVKRAFSALGHVPLFLFSLFAVTPFVLSFVVSISDEKNVVMNGYSFLPAALSLDAYRLIFSDITIVRSYGISILVTVTGTLLSTTICALAGYAMSNPKVRYRNSVALFFYIPMVFSAGLVPWYLTVSRTLMLKNSLLALIFPLLVSPFNIFLLRNYFKTIPQALIEAAEIDGARPIYIFFKIVLPLSTPIIATIVLFISLAYWNDWVLALWFIDSKELYPLQFMLYRIQSLILFINSNGGQFTGNTGNLPMQTVQIATLFVTIGPIILVYPFIQQYFIKGIMIGAIKG